MLHLPFLVVFLFCCIIFVRPLAHSFSRCHISSRPVFRFFLLFTNVNEIPTNSNSTHVHCSLSSVFFRSGLPDSFTFWTRLVFFPPKPYGLPSL
ncbi:hypothetical protein F5051DRAFT_407057 [Lentinula edodes]|nr:hypothetical protein F5051DRAFT_407057 [Lentinula edodes]